MARTGNHGIQIPRDKGLLTRMYWADNMTLQEMADVFGVTYCSVRRVLHDLSIPVRTKTLKKVCECGKPIKKIWHPKLRVFYGRKCADCRRNHYNKLSREYQARPDRMPIRRAGLRRWYYEGPLNPSTESEWISLGRARLRATKRLLTKGRAASPLRSEVSGQATSSRSS